MKLRSDISRFKTTARQTNTITILLLLLLLLDS
jgi:hypothetical protein